MVTEADDGNWKDQYEQQADANLSQNSPVSGTKYTVLDTTQNVRIYSIAAKIDWNATQPTPLQIHVTIDGQTIVYQVTNPTDNTYYYAQSAPSDAAANQDLVLAANLLGKTFILEGKSVKVEAEITAGDGAATLDTLAARVKYAKK